MKFNVGNRVKVCDENDVHCGVIGTVFEIHLPADNPYEIVTNDMEHFVTKESSLRRAGRVEKELEFETGNQVEIVNDADGYGGYRGYISSVDHWNSSVPYKVEIPEFSDHIWCEPEDLILASETDKNSIELKNALEQIQRMSEEIEGLKAEIEKLQNKKEEFETIKTPEEKINLWCQLGVSFSVTRVELDELNDVVGDDIKVGDIVDRWLSEGKGRRDGDSCFPLSVGSSPWDYPIQF